MGTGASVEQQQALSMASQDELRDMIAGLPPDVSTKLMSAALPYKPLLHFDGLKWKAPKLGIIRLDYDYEAAPGDIDHPESFGYEVVYRVVPGFTFGLCQKGHQNVPGTMPSQVELDFIAAVRWLENKGVSSVTGDCGFMMWYQAFTRQQSKRPIVSSALAQLPAVTCAYGKNELIAIFTANGETLPPMSDLIKEECGVDPEATRFIIVGCQDVDGFEAVANGDKVDVAKVTPGVVKLAMETMTKHPGIRAFLLECTELPPYADSIRAATGLPVYDSITASNFVLRGVMDNACFGRQGWQEKWNGKHEVYRYGEELTPEERSRLVNKSQIARLGGGGVVSEPPLPQCLPLLPFKTLLPFNDGKWAAPKLGIIRLDYDYEAAPGDIDHPESFGYEVLYRVVPGFTFGLCQKGHQNVLGTLPAQVEMDFLAAIKWLEDKGVSGITGDCGFMMYYQALIRNHTQRPVFMSSLAQLPAVTCAYGKDELIAIFTANGETLPPMRDLLKEECGVDPEETRFIIVGCQDVDGFEAVANGDKVDVPKVTPGMVNLAKETLKKHPSIRAFFLECTELPPYADSIRAATGLPVYDAITASNFFMSGVTDNPRFGRQDWQEKWNGTHKKYRYGEELTSEERSRLVNQSNIASMS